jgi:hypothetical protein
MLKRLPVPLALLALITAACGGGSGTTGVASLQGGSTLAASDSASTTAAGEVDSEQAMLDFTACMREQGIDMADPQTSTDGGAGFRLQPGTGAGDTMTTADREKMQAAREACSQYLEGIAQQFERPDMSEMQDQMLAYAQCMRDNGVDMPDPDFSQEGGGGMFGFGSGDQGIDPNDPAFQTAQEACQEIFGGGPGGGPGGGIMVGPGGPEGGVVPAPGSDGSSSGSTP